MTKKLLIGILSKFSTTVLLLWIIVQFPKTWDFLLVSLQFLLSLDDVAVPLSLFSKKIQLCREEDTMLQSIFKAELQLSFQ